MRRNGKRFSRKQLDKIAAADGYVFFQVCDGMPDRALYEHSETGRRKVYLNTGRSLPSYMPRGASRKAFQRPEELFERSNLVNEEWELRKERREGAQ